MFILHIGLPKTGSSALQTFLSQNREGLQARGAYYPTSPGPVVHRMLSAVVSPRRRNSDERLWRGRNPEPRIERFRELFVAEMTALPQGVDRVILSEERLSLMLHKTAELAELRAFLEPYAGSFKIVIYLRRQDLLLASLYTQVLRKGTICTPAVFKEQAAKSKLYDYLRLLRPWMEIFGSDAVIPRLYENEAGTRFDTTEDFKRLPFVGLGDLEPGSATEIYPSVNASGQQALVALGTILQERAGPDDIKGPRWKRITDLMTQIAPGKGWQPTREEAEAFLADYRSGNETLRRRFFPERPMLFVEDFADRPDANGEVSQDAIETLLCEALFAAVDSGLVLEAAQKAEKKAGSRHSIHPEPALPTAE